MPAAGALAADHCDVDATVESLRNVSATLRTAKVRLKLPIACVRHLHSTFAETSASCLHHTASIHANQSQRETLLSVVRGNRAKDIAVVCVSLRTVRTALPPDCAGLPAPAARTLELHYVRFADALLEQVLPLGPTGARGSM
jgi:hypothetical protein